MKAPTVDDLRTMTGSGWTTAETDLVALGQVERRVLWLATRIIDEANRRTGGEVKVGGHQTSCASMVSIMTTLWFWHISGEDKVPVKPHASPVYHAIKYLTGKLDRSYLTTLRQRGGLHAAEPAFATEVDWLLCDALDQLSQPNGESCYLRLSTRPIDQSIFGEAMITYGEDQLRAMVLAGGYRLIDCPPTGRPGMTLVATGSMVPEAVAAARELDDEGIDASALYLTSPDRAYRSWQQTYSSAIRSGRVARTPSLIHRLIPAEERSRPIISVHDAASHSLAWVGSTIGTRQFSLGVDQFGESGTIKDLHEIVGISTGDIVNATLVATHE